MSDHTGAVAEHVGGTTQSFIYIWIALLAMTGVEVLLAYEQVPVLIMLTALLGPSISAGYAAGQYDLWAYVLGQGENPKKPKLLHWKVQIP